MEWVGRFAVHLSSRECCLKQLLKLLRDIQRNLSYLEHFIRDTSISMWTKDKLLLDGFQARLEKSIRPVEFIFGFQLGCGI